MTIEEKICGLIELEENWDSYGAKTIDPRCIQEAVVIAERYATTGIQVVPMPNGGVQLERHADGLDIEIYIAPAKEVGDESKNNS